MDLFIIRHAQSTNNALIDQRSRVVDPPLTETGRQQAQLVAQFVAHGLETDPMPASYAGNGHNRRGLAINRLYCSAMLRALDTAQAISHAAGLQPQVWLDVHEEGGMWLDHGEQGILGYGGMTRSEIAAQFPGCVLPETVTEQGWWTTGQEEMTLFRARARRAADALKVLAHEAPEDRIGIVTHGGFGAELLKAIFNVPPEQSFFFYHNNTGISKVRFRADGRISMRYQNRLNHLPAELIT